MLFVIQLIKLVVSTLGFIVFMTFAQNVSTVKNVKFVLIAIVLESLFLAFLTKMDKRFVISRYITFILDIFLLMWGIYVSHYAYNTFQFWLVAIVLAAFQVTNIIFASVLLFACTLFVIFWRSFLPLGSVYFAAPDGYLASFLVSTVFFFFALFLLFAYSDKAKRQFGKGLRQMILKQQHTMSFPENNPSPIFEYNNQELIPINQVSQHFLNMQKSTDLDDLKNSLDYLTKDREVKGFFVREFQEESYKVNWVKIGEKQINLYFTDVTELVFSRRLALEREQYSRAILDSIPGYVTWVDKDLNYLGVNKNMADLFKVKPSSFLGRKLGDLTSASDAEHNNLEIRNLVIDFFKSGQHLLQQEMKFYRDGDLINVFMSMSKYNNGKNAILISVDITELKKAQSMLADEQKRAESSARLAAFGEMAAGIAHEINNPLAIISAKLMKMTKLVQAQEIDTLAIVDSIEKVESSVERIVKIIKGLKNLARDGNNDSFELAQVSDIIDDSLTLLRKKCELRNIDLMLDNQLKDQSIECQRVQISQVLVILINNALDALEVNTDLSQWIKIEAFDAGENEILINVSDSGPGISSEIIDKIFGPFFTTKEVGKGTGLGLSLAHKILTHHNGSIQVDKEVSHTKFCLRLPKKHS